MQARSRYMALARVLTLSFLLLLPMATTLAATKTAPKVMSGKIASIWVIWPKAGQQQEFETAIKAYAAWRKHAGEHFAWSIYQPVVGTDLNHYVIRSENHEWKDIDDNVAWERQNKAGQQFVQQVGASVAREEHFLEETDTDHSHWVDSDAYKYFGVSSLNLKLGSRGDMEDALGKIHKALMDSNWPRSYSIAWEIGGNGPMLFVQPFKSYAEMAEPNPSFMQVLAKGMGSEDAAKAAMKQINSSFDSEQYTVYEYRPDLSTPK